MKKIVIALLAIALVLSFVSCDAMVTVMGKMGSNAAGVEQKLIDDSLKAAKPATSSTVDNEDGSKTFTKSDGEESKALITVKDDGSETVLSIGGGESSLSIKLDPGALDGVEAILTPTDITDVLNGLKGGSKSAIEEELTKPADEESRKAAEGTQKVISAIVDMVGLPEPVSEEDMAEMTEEEKKEAEALNSALDTLDLILGNTEKEMTQADVVVLTAITNVVFNEDVISSLDSLVKEENESMTEDEKKELKKEQEEAQQKLTEVVANEAITMVDVVTVVPSDMASGILDLMNLLSSSSGSKE